MTTWPDPSAPRAVVDAFVAALPPVLFCAHCHRRTDQPAAFSCRFPDTHDPASKAATDVPVAPSVVCNGCGYVPARLPATFCSNCLAALAEGSVP